MRWLMVVLPAPDGPTSATELARLDVEVDVVQYRARGALVGTAIDSSEASETSAADG